MAKETIGIEALLHRAYGQYRVDRVTPEAVLGMQRFRPGNSLVGAMSALQLGTIVDNSGVAARLLSQQSMAVATPDDLLVLHDHVLALSDWLIEGADSDAAQVWRRSEIAANGWRIENAATGHWLVRPGEGRASDAWSRLHEPFLTALVIEHARNATRPDHGGALPVVRGRPGEEALRERADAMLCRAVYATWYAALSLLAAELDGVLNRHSVLPPVSPSAPWERDAKAVVHASRAGSARNQGNLASHKPLKRQGNRRL